MRKVTFGGASSLDNFFARKDGGMDWDLISPRFARLGYVLYRVKPD